MSTQANDARTPAPSIAAGVEALASATLATLRRTVDRALPLWLGLTAVYAMVHVVASRALGDDRPVLQQIIDNETWMLVTLLVTALGSAVALRLFLGRRREALQVDGPLGTYVGIFCLLGIAPGMMLARLHPPTRQMVADGLHGDLAPGLLGLAVGLGMFVAYLGLTLWPIAQLLGDRRVTGEQSWILMRGAVARYAGALILLTAPLLLIDTALAVLTAHAPPLIRDVPGPPLHAALCILAAAVAAEVYRTRLKL